MSPRCCLWVLPFASNQVRICLHSLCVMQIVLTSRECMQTEASSLSKQLSIVL
uniref:Uncharacterized protein n=1 Tax=Anguilla anguilla TaxID=7936 RepID=A0A0E9X183_ANGAN